MTRCCDGMLQNLRHIQVCITSWAPEVLQESHNGSRWGRLQCSCVWPSESTKRSMADSHAAYNASSTLHQCEHLGSHMFSARPLMRFKTFLCAHREGLQISVTPCRLQQRQRTERLLPRSSARCSAVCRCSCQTAPLALTVVNGKCRVHSRLLLAAAACMLSVQPCDAAELESQGL